MIAYVIARRVVVSAKESNGSFSGTQLNELGTVVLPLLLVLGWCWCEYNTAGMVCDPHIQKKRGERGPDLTSS